MAHTEAYLTAKQKALAIMASKVITPTVPIDITLVEAENLSNYAINDQDQLVAKGLNPEVINDLVPRINLLKDAQSEWMISFNGKVITLEQWTEASEKAYQLQREFAHVFRFAYRKDHKLMVQVNRISDGNGHADMIQDLSDYAALGKANPEPLQAVNYDMSKLDLADELSVSTRTLLGKVNGIRTETGKPEKEFRDRAYTYLKQAVDEVRDFGKFVFWEDEGKLKHYSSEYLRKIRAQNKKQAETAE